MCDKINQMIDCKLVYERKLTMGENGELLSEETTSPLKEEKLYLHNLPSHQKDVNARAYSFEHDLLLFGSLN